MSPEAHLSTKDDIVWEGCAVKPLGGRTLWQEASHRTGLEVL